MIRKFIALLLFCSSVQATTFSTDASDLWWNANESGWGVNVIHQGEVVFLTFFVYGQNGAPTWYSASPASSSSLTFSGPLYQTNGSWLGAPWNPASVSYRQVGSVTFTLTSVYTATLSYTVDGVAVNKQLTRLTWRVNDISGSYIGAAVGTYSGCAASVNGYIEDAAFITVTQNVVNGGNITIQASGPSGTCTYSGTYTQAGRMGFINGAFSCNTGFSGSFVATEVEASISAMTARAVAQSGSCTWTGRIGGLRRF